MNPCPALNYSGCQQYTKDADDCGYEYGAQPRPGHADQHDYTRFVNCVI